MLVTVTTGSGQRTTTQEDADLRSLTDFVSPKENPISSVRPSLVLCAVNEPLADAWRSVLDAMGASVQLHTESILTTTAQAVVSPANSYGWMRGGIDAVYARAFPNIEHEVRSTILTYHGGQLPVGEAVLVPTQASSPAWLISAPTMREPTEQLPNDTVHPYLAARAVFLLWRNGRSEQGIPMRQAIRTIAMPGLGTGVGGVAPQVCAEQVAAAWTEVFDSP